MNCTTLRTLLLEANAQFVGNARVLQPSAQVQDVHHRLQRVVLVSGDQRRRTDGGAAQRQDGERLGSRCVWPEDSPPIRTLAQRLNAFVLPHQVLPVLKGIATIFRESDVLRENRDRARLKFLFLKHGWTSQKVPRRIAAAHRLPAGAGGSGKMFPTMSIATTSGFTQQKQPGYFYVGASVLRGRITCRAARRWPPIWPNAMPAGNCAPPTCRTC